MSSNQKLKLKSCFLLFPNREKVLAKQPSIVIVWNIDWSWTYFLYQQPNLNELCMERHFGPLRSFIICFWASFNSPLARDKVPSKFHRAKTLFPSPSLSLKLSDFSLSLPRKAWICFSMYQPTCILFYSLIHWTVTCFAWAAKVFNSSVFFQGYSNLIVAWFDMRNMDHKVYELVELYRRPAETNNRPTSDKATVAAMFCWSWVFFNFVYGIMWLWSLSLFERFESVIPS